MFKGVVIAVMTDGENCLLLPHEIQGLMDGLYFVDNTEISTYENKYPKDPGVYIADIKYQFQQGVCEGESEWDFIPVNVQKVNLEEIPQEKEAKREVGIEIRPDSVQVIYTANQGEFLYTVEGSEENPLNILFSGRFKTDSYDNKLLLNDSKKDESTLIIRGARVRARSMKS